MRHHLRRLRRDGISLIELIVVIFIIGIMSTVGGARYGAMANTVHAEWGARRVAADLNMARRRAMVMGKSVTVIFNTATHSYSIPNVSSLDRSGQIYQMNLATTPFQATLASVSFPGGTGGALQVEFDHYGGPDSGGSVVVRCGATTKTVLLNAVTGEATLL